MLQIIVEFIGSIIPGERFLVAGESYGGYLARGLVNRLEDRIDGLLLLCPVVFAAKSSRTLPPHTVIFTDPALANEADEDLLSIAVVQAPETWQRYRDEVVCGLQIADREFLEKYSRDGYAFSFDVDRLARPFEKPVLILTGRQDSVTGYEDVWGKLHNYPRATFAVLDRAGHNLRIEQPRVFNVLVEEWLQRVKDRGR